MLQISIAWCQIEAEIRSFPTMYGKGGVYVVKIGEIKVFVQKLCLKQGFFEDTNLDHLTSGWPRTHCFRGDANFDMFPKKYGSKASKWAMGTSGSFKIVRTTASYFFSPSGHGKWAKKVLFRIFANYSNAKIFRRYPGAIWKLTYWRFRKCGSF